MARVNVYRPKNLKWIGRYEYKGEAAIPVRVGKKTISLGGSGLGITASIDIQGHVSLKRALLNGPRNLALHMVDAMREIGAEDIARLRIEQLSGGTGLTLKNKGLQKSFKFRAPDKSKVRELRQVFLSEYTRWPGAEGHTKGGVIQAKSGRSMPIPLPGRFKWDRFSTAGGRRSFSDMIARDLAAGKNGASGSFIRIFRNPNTGKVLIIRDVNHLTKTGKGRKGNRIDVIGVFKKRVVLKKRLDMQGNFNRATGRHDMIISRNMEAAAKTIQSTP